MLAGVLIWPRLGLPVCATVVWLLCFEAGDHGGLSATGGADVLDAAVGRLKRKNRQMRRAVTSFRPSKGMHQTSRDDQHPSLVAVEMFFRAARSNVVLLQCWHLAWPIGDLLRVGLRHEGHWGVVQR